MSFFKVEIERNTQSFLKSLVERVCGSIDGIAKVVADKKITASFRLE